MFKADDLGPEVSSAPSEGGSLCLLSSRLLEEWMPTAVLATWFKFEGLRFRAGSLSNPCGGGSTL